MSRPPRGGSGGSHGYRQADSARYAEEPDKGAGDARPRGPFERDRARVLHSAALRRLADKTQVVGPHSDDFVRNRLTHSLEVAQVARDLARQLGCDADIVETAALAHDLGHPPFGHNGEHALNEVSQAAGGFEGNAQSLRILTRLEAKTLDDEGRSVGLNLTRATLDAVMKYPWVRGEGPAAAEHGKFGVYADDVPVFAWVREGAPPLRRCLEAQVMDLSDDIAYSVHDVEDGVVAGRIDLAGLRDPDLLARVWRTARDWYLPGADDTALQAGYERLRMMPSWPAEPYDGTRGTSGLLKDLTSGLIGRFCSSTTLATRKRFGDGPHLRYAADLVVPQATVEEIVVLKAIAAELVMRAEDRLTLLERQRQILTDLVDLVAASAPESLSPALRDDYRQAGDERARLRVVVDQVASLTDTSAVAWHRRLSGSAPTR